jgi:hypothetical protein
MLCAAISYSDIKFSSTSSFNLSNYSLIFKSYKFLLSKNLNKLFLRFCYNKL